MQPEAGAVARLPRMGTRAQEQLLEAIADHRKLIARLPLPRAERIGRRLVDFARSLETVQAAELVGSIRRGEETVGDIDLIAASDNPSATTAAFATAAGLRQAASSRREHGLGKNRKRPPSRPLGAVAARLRRRSARLQRH
jgi:DNA polymerase/3'-5' exonuclease PolX